MRDELQESVDLYVLGLLEGEELLAFEKDLGTSAELQAAVRESKEALLYAFQSPSAVSSLRFGDLEKGLGGGGEGVKILDRARKVTQLPWAWIWASAATVLLILNFLLVRGSDPGDFSAGSDSLVEIAGTSGGSALKTSTLPVRTAEDPILLLESEIRRLEEDIVQRDLVLEERQAQLEGARRVANKMETTLGSVQTKYDTLAMSFLPFFEGINGANQYTVIWMVDADSTSSGLLAGSANPFLSETDRLWSSDLASAGDLAQAASLGWEASISGTDMVSSGTPADMPMTDAMFEAINGGESVGFMVWRDKNQQGYLALYNLPATDPGFQATLWIRADSSGAYLRIGPLPELSGGSGSVYYSISDSEFQPGEVLITAEAADSLPGNPSGEILLRGGP